MRVLFDVQASASYRVPATRSSKTNAQLRVHHVRAVNDAPPPTIAAASSFGDPLLLSELVRHYDPRFAGADGSTALMDAA
jgi:hypothetical protein